MLIVNSPAVVFSNSSPSTVNFESMVSIYQINKASGVAGFFAAPKFGKP